LARLRSLRPRENERDALLALAWIWVLVPLVFFSLSTSKLPGYVLPIFPAMAIVLGAEVERVWNNQATRWGQFAVVPSLLLLLLSGAAVGGYLQKKGVLDSAVAAFAGLILAVVVIAIAWRTMGKSRAAVLSPVIVTACLVAGITLFVFPRIHDDEKVGVKPLALQIAQLLKPNEDIVLFHRDRIYAPVFYNAGRVEFYQGGRIVQGVAHGEQFDVETATQLIQALKHEQSEGESSAILIATRGRREVLQRDARFVTQAVAQQGKYAALRVSLRPGT
jgi:hypothetical protein